MPFLIASLVFLAVVLVGYAFSAALQRRENTEQKIRDRLHLAGRRSTAGGGASLLKDERLSSIGILDSLLSRLSLARSLTKLTREAGLRNRVGEIFLYIVLSGLAGLLLGLLLTDNLTIALACAAVLALIPVVVLRRRRNRRMKLFSEQLPDSLDLIRAALQAGHSFGAALLVVAEEFPDPIAEEFRIVAEEMRLGLPTREALYNLRERVDDPNVPILIVGILVAHEVGGNMAEVLDNTAYTVRERFKLLRDVLVMTAQGRMSGRLLTALPILVALAMVTLNPLYFMPMLESQTGRYMIAYAVLSVTAGHFMIQRIVNIRV
jgi:tight adherence protein B